jgi:hypothetical protein
MHFLPGSEGRVTDRSPDEKVGGFTGLAREDLADFIPEHDRVDIALLEPTNLVFGSHTVSGVWRPDYVGAGLTGPTLGRLFELYGRPELRTYPGPSFSLAHAHEAQEVLVDRNTVGKVQIDVRAG